MIMYLRKFARKLERIIWYYTFFKQQILIKASYYIEVCSRDYINALAHVKIEDSESYQSSQFQ